MPSLIRRLCVVIATVGTLSACAPTTSVDSKKFQDYGGNPKKLLVVFSMSPDFIDSTTVRTQMGNLLTSCGIENRFIFIEASYSGSYSQVASESNRKIYLNARQKIEDFKEDAVLEVIESNKSMYHDMRYGYTIQTAASFGASLIDQARQAKVWIAAVQVSSGGITRNSRERADVMSRNIVGRLISDGIIKACSASASTENQ